MKILWFIGRALRRLCLVLGALVLVSGVSSCVIGLYVMDQMQDKPLGKTAVLVVRLQPNFNQTDTYSVIENPFGARAPGLIEVLNALDQARQDPKIKGVVFSLRGVALDMASVQELRQAIAGLRAVGKKTLVFAPSYDGTTQYYLASAFDDIWLQPVGTVTIDGFGGEMPFFKGLMDKLGVRANFIQRKEYKSVMEPFLYTKLSDPARANISELLNDLAAQMVADIGKDRNIKVDILWEAINRGVLTGDEAKTAGLITHLDHGDQVPRAIRQQLGVAQDNDKAVDFVTVDDYLALTDPTVHQPWLETIKPKQAKVSGGRKRVALVTVDGPIYADHEQGGMMDQAGGLSADDIADAIMDATADDGVAAILVRINSPGGTPSGSEDIRRSLELARTKGKPVVISMGSMAASGGYWVASAGDYIFADAATLTGSIGVVGGKFDLEALSKTWGITWDGVKMGDNVNLNALHTPYNDTERARMNVLMDDVYQHFTALVAKGRKLDQDVVEGLAGGRVYTGRQAKEINLVDQIGGYQDAVAYVAQVLKVGGADQLLIEEWPARLTPVQELVALLQGQVMMGQMMTNVMAVFSGGPRVQVMMDQRLAW